MCSSNGIEAKEDRILFILLPGSLYLTGYGSQNQATKNIHEDFSSQLLNPQGIDMGHQTTLSYTHSLATPSLIFAPIYRLHQVHVAFILIIRCGN